MPWSSMDRQTFFKQFLDGKPKELRQFLNSDIVDVWDELFDLSYFQFRAGLVNIANRSFEAVSGAELVFGSEGLERELVNKDDCLIIPTDDDDCLSPHIAKVLRHRSGHMIGWPTLEATQGRLIKSHGIPFSKTNNTAYCKSFLMDHYGTEIFPMLADHRMIRRTMPAEDKAGLEKIRRTLSLINRTGASLSFLVQLHAQHGSADKPEFGDKLKRVLESSCQVLETYAKNHQWLRTYLMQTLRLHRQCLGHHVKFL